MKATDFAKVRIAVRRGNASVRRAAYEGEMLARYPEREAEWELLKRAEWKGAEGRVVYWWLAAGRSPYQVWLEAMVAAGHSWKEIEEWTIKDILAGRWVKVRALV